MISRSSAAFVISFVAWAGFGAACKKSPLPGCPADTVFLAGVCRPSCADITECLNGESCDMALGVCLPKIAEPLPTIRRFTATPMEFSEPGQEIELSFEVGGGAKTVEITPGAFARAEAASGTAFVSVFDSTTFTLHAYNGDNNEVRRDVTVTRIGGRLVIAELTATPAEARLDQEVTFRWTVNNGAGASIRLVDPTNMRVVGEQLDPSGALMERVTYLPVTLVLEALAPDGFLARRSVTVLEAIEGQPRFVRFEADPPSIAPGDTALIRWRTQGALEFDLTENDLLYRSTNDRAEVARGFEIVGPEWESVYRGYAKASDSTTEESTVLSIREPTLPSIHHFGVAPELRGDANQSVITVEWDVSEVAEVMLFENDLQIGSYQGSDRYTLQGAETNMHYRIEAYSADGNAVQDVRHSWLLVDESELFPVPDREEDDVTHVAIRASLISQLDEEDLFTIQAGEDGLIDARIATEDGGCDPIFATTMTFTLLEAQTMSPVTGSYDDGGCLRITKYGLPRGTYVFQVNASPMFESLPYAIYAGWYAGRCGDDHRGSQEQCDDGNRINGDGCDASCIGEPAAVTEYDVASPPNTILIPPDAVLTVADFEPIGQNSGAEDDGVAAVALPFPFRFFANTYAGLWIHTNGMITLRPEDRARMPNGALPSEERPNAVIAPFMANLRLADFADQRPGSVAYFETAGPAPGTRRFNVVFRNLTGKEHDADNHVLLDAIVSLEEDGAIRFQYGTVTSRGDAGALSFAAGIEDASGKLGVAVPGCDSTCTKDQVGGRNFLFTPRRN